MTTLKHNLEFQIISFYSENSEEIIDSDSEINSESDSDSDSDSDFDVDSDSYSYSPNKNFKKNTFKKDNSKFCIYLFGKDANEKTYSLKVEDFTPYFYVLIPDSINKSQLIYFENWVRENMWSKYKDNLLRCTFHKKKKFRNFDRQRDYKFIRLVFSNTNALRSAQSLFQDKKYDNNTGKFKTRPKKILINEFFPRYFEYSLYENMVDSLLKFIHHKGIDTVGWITVEKGKYYKDDDDENINCDYSFKTNWTDIKTLKDKDNTKIKIMAYDIEADSSHGDFPLPIKDYTKLGREIYSTYLKINNSIREKKLSHFNREVYTKYYNNIYEYVSDCLISAFKDGDKLLEINKIYTKDNILPNKNLLKNISNQIKDIISNDFISSNLESKSSIEIKNIREKSIRNIIKILSKNLPEIEGDKTIQIGMVFIKYGEKIPYKKYMLTLNTCSKINDCETKSFKTESQLLLYFTKIINLENPDIITGWNTDGFDTPWLFKRAKELEIYEDFARMSLFKEFISELKEKQVKGHTGQLIKKEYIELPGRVQLDLLPLVQKSYNLDSYKLDSVSSDFINGKIIKLEFNNNQTKVYTSSLVGLNNYNFVVFNQTEGYLKKKFMNGKKFEVYNLDLNENTFCINEVIELNIDNTSWCIGKDDVSPQDIFRLQKGNSSDRAIIAKYCLMDTVLCVELMNKLEILNNNIGMANVCKIPLSWIIQRGQGVRILSLMAYFLRKKNYLIPFLYKDTFDKEGYEGAVVLDPKPGIYINKPVAVLDYGSLYPSSMIEFNISHETIVTDEKYLGDSGKELLDKEGYDCKDISYDRFKTIFTASGTVKGKIKVGVNNVRFVQYRDNTKGLLPEILQYLLNTRKMTRNKAKYKTIKTNYDTYIGLFNKDKKTVSTPENTYQFKDDEHIIEIQDTYNEFKKQILDGFQLAYKVIANSVYGALGAKTSDIYYKELAASTTAVGRERLLLAKNFALNENNYPQILNNGKTIYLKNEIIYGDTDSIFVHFQSLDNDGKPLNGREARKKNIELAIYTEKKIEKILEKPQNLEYEKTFDPFILISKKRYVGKKYEIDPDKFKMTSMGLVTKRRDNAPIVKVIYGGIIDIIMEKQDIVPATTYFRKILRDLINGKFELDTLIISKTLSAFYKDPDRQAHKVLADRMGERDPGNKPQVNDRIPYVYIETSKKTNLQGDRIETPQYIKDNKLTPDYEFYITNQIMKPVTQIFALSLEKIPGYRNNIIELNNKYNEYINKGKSENDSIKYMIECKRKEAQNILLKDILRLLENKRLRNNEITHFFKIIKS